VASGLVRSSLGGLTTAYTTGPAGPRRYRRHHFASLAAYTQAGAYAVMHLRHAKIINTLRPAEQLWRYQLLTSRDGHASYHITSGAVPFKAEHFSTFQAAYTWSHTIANIEEDQANGGASPKPASSRHPEPSRGSRQTPPSTDRTSVVFNEVFFLPKLAHHAALRPRNCGRMGVQHHLHCGERQFNRRVSEQLGQPGHGSIGS